MTANEQVIRAAFLAVEGFPFSVSGWLDLDQGTQVTIVANLIEALASLGFGAAEPTIGLLLDSTRWEVDHVGSPAHVHQWYEPTLFRMRVRNALGFAQDERDIEAVASFAPRIEKLMPYLVVVDTILHPNVLERSPPDNERLRQLRDSLVRIRREQATVRVEDQLYMRTLSRRLPVLGMPVEGRSASPSIASLVHAAVASKEPGRVRRLGFLCEALGRTDAQLLSLAMQVFEVLRAALDAGALEPTRQFLRDHVTPRCLIVRPELVRAYNASLAIRNARFVLDAPALDRLQRWARHVWAVRGISITPSRMLVEHRTSATGVEPIVYVERLVDGRNHPVEEMSPQAAEALMSSNTFDLLVDEPRRLLLIRREGRLHEDAIGKVRPMIRACLWLVLTRVGGEFTPKDIEGLRRNRTIQVRSNALEQYVTSCRRYVGSGLAARILPQREWQEYRVPDAGWSFCWIRQSRSRSQSRLLYGLTKPLEFQ